MAGERVFIGPLTERQQFLRERREATKELNEYRPDRCRGCTRLGLEIAGLSLRVAKGEINVFDAAREEMIFAMDCPGLRENDTVHDGEKICPIEEQEERDSRPDCW